MTRYQQRELIRKAWESVNARVDSMTEKPLPDVTDKVSVEFYGNRLYDAIEAELSAAGYVIVPKETK